MHSLGKTKQNAIKNMLKGKWKKLGNLINNERNFPDYFYTPTFQVYQNTSLKILLKSSKRNYLCTYYVPFPSFFNISIKELHMQSWINVYKTNITQNIQSQKLKHYAIINLFTTIEKSDFN